MTQPRMMFPEVAGKVISEVSIHTDEEFGKEVLLRFSDETQLSIAIGVHQTVDARFCNESTPDLPLSHKRFE